MSEEQRVTTPPSLSTVRIYPSIHEALTRVQRILFIHGTDFCSAPERIEFTFWRRYWQVPPADSTTNKTGGGVLAGQQTQALRKKGWFDEVSMGLH